MGISLCAISLCLHCKDDRGFETGALRLHLGQSPAGDYRQLLLELQRVDGYGRLGNGEMGWVILATPNRTISLVRGGAPIANGAGSTSMMADELLTQTAVPVGQYEQLRLTLGPRSTLRLLDGSLHALLVPPPLLADLKLRADFAVKKDAVSDATISFDSAEVRPSGSGMETSYALRAPQMTPMSPSSAATGSINGRLVDRNSGAGIAGVSLFGEVIGKEGRPTIVRTAITSDDGSYIMTMLPLDETYYIVSRPYVNGVLYDAQTSDPLTLTQGAPTACYNDELTVSRATGSVGGALTPTAGSDESDQLSLSKQFSKKSGLSPWLIVDTTLAQVGTSETYTFTSVPIDFYGVFATRLVVHQDGSISVGALSTSAPFTIMEGQVVTADISYP